MPNGGFLPLAPAVLVSYIATASVSACIRNRTANVHLLCGPCLFVGLRCFCAHFCLAFIHVQLIYLRICLEKFFIVSPWCRQTPHCAKCSCVRAPCADQGSSACLHLCRCAWAGRSASALASQQVRQKEFDATLESYCRPLRALVWLVPHI